MAVESICLLLLPPSLPFCEFLVTFLYYNGYDIINKSCFFLKKINIDIYLYILIRDGGLIMKYGWFLLFFV